MGQVDNSIEEKLDALAEDFEYKATHTSSMYNEIVRKIEEISRSTNTIYKLLGTGALTKLVGLGVVLVVGVGASVKLSWDNTQTLRALKVNLVYVLSENRDYKESVTTLSSTACIGCHDNPYMTISGLAGKFDTKEDFIKFIRDGDVMPKISESEIKDYELFEIWRKLR